MNTSLNLKWGGVRGEWPGRAWSKNQGSRAPLLAFAKTPGPRTDDKSAQTYRDSQVLSRTQVDKQTDLASEKKSRGPNTSSKPEDGLHVGQRCLQTRSLNVHKWIKGKVWHQQEETAGSVEEWPLAAEAVWSKYTPRKGPVRRTWQKGVWKGWTDSKPHKEKSGVKFTLSGEKIPRWTPQRVHQTSKGNYWWVVNYLFPATHLTVGRYIRRGHLAGVAQCKGAATGTWEWWEPISEKVPRLNAPCGKGGIGAEAPQNSRHKEAQSQPQNSPRSDWFFLFLACALHIFPYRLLVCVPTTPWLNQTWQCRTSPYQIAHSEISWEERSCSKHWKKWKKIETNTFS